MTYGKEWRLGLVCGLIAGAVAGWIGTTMAGWVIASETKNWWDIATAIGTVGATVAAAAGVLLPQLAALRDKRQRAVHAAASIYLYLGLSQKPITTIISRLSNTALTRKSIEVLIKDLKIVADSFPTFDTAGLDLLGDECGARLKAAFGILDLVLILFRAAHEECEDNQLTDMSRERLRQAGAQLAIVFATVSEIGDRCRKVAAPLEQFKQERPSYS